MSSLRRVETRLGTFVDIDIRECEKDESELDVIIHAALARLDEIDHRFSTYKHHSEISRIGRGELLLGEAHPEVREILLLSESLRHISDGHFDVYGAAAHEPALSVQQSNLPGARAIEPSGVVKGWAIDQMVNIFHQSNLGDFCISVGGDLFVSGHEDGHPWHIGLQHPLQRDKVMAVLAVSDVAVATSGLYERGDHIVRKDLSAPPELLSVTIVGPDITLADAYATAAFAMGKAGVDWAANLPGFEVFAVDTHNQTHFTPGLAALFVQ